MEFIKKKKRILFVLTAMLIVFFLIIGNKNKGNQLEQIKNSIIANESFNMSLVEENKKSIESKNDKTSVDYFILGYYEELDENIDLTTEYYRLAVQLMNQETDTYVILHTTTFLAKNAMEERQFQQALNYVTIGVNNLEASDYNEYAKEIWKLFLVTINSEQGQTLAIKKFENLLKDELNMETKLYLISKLAPLYCLNNQYADSITVSLRGIELAEKLNDKLTEGKFLVELGNMFKILGNYEIAREPIEAALNLEIEDEYGDQQLKLYAYTNLAEISFLLEDYDETLKYTQLMEKYESNLNEDRIKEYQILRYLIYSELAINYEKFDIAGEYLLKASQLFELNQQTIVEKDLYYLNTLGKLLYHEGKYDEAIETYEKLLELSRVRNYLEFQRESILQLLTIYQDLNQMDNYQMMTNELIDFLNSEQVRTGNDYIFYTIQSYQNELIMQKTLKFKIMIMGICTILGSTIIYGILKFMKLVALSHKDHLTNLYNRRYFDKLYGILKKRKKGCFSVILLDIDDFKKINDCYGHEIGDAVLVNLSKIVKSMLGKREYAFRYGGEEFAILVVDKSNEQVMELAESLRDKVSRTIVSPNIQFTISLGVAHSNHLSESLFKRADENLYYSKAKGKNRVTE